MIMKIIFFFLNMPSIIIRIIIQCIWTTWLVHNNAYMARADIFTSIEKMKDIFFHEKQLLSGIKRALKSVDATPEIEKILRFCNDRQEQRWNENFKESVINVKHPNEVYIMIKHFVEIYKEVRLSIKKISIPYLQSMLQNIPSTNDLHGAKISLLRLQEVYNLDSGNMADGNYKGYHGPPLGTMDTFDIGMTAFEDENLPFYVDQIDQAQNIDIKHKYELSRQWFDITRAKLILNQTSDLSLERVVSLNHQARVFSKARVKTGLKNVRLSSLIRALNNNYAQQHAKDIIHAEMKKVDGLCATMDQKYLRTGPPYVCRYKPMVLLYNRIKEEILSSSPYVSLIYNVTTSKESNAIQKLASRQLFRAEVQEVQGLNRSDYRTSHVAFLGENDSKYLASLTKRISHLTGLDCLSNPDGHQLHQSAGEKYQIVNYGIGGHYAVHMDTYETSFPGSEDILKHSGNRMATVLIYLSKVESGGSTVFPWLNIAVPPLQHAALLWYNIDTSGTVDFRTRHAGCPVLVGNKWIMNKWILSHANTFKHPCGRSKTLNQQRIEKILNV